MSAVGQREILTQKCVIAFFRDALGYAYLGHWKDREGNSNVEEALLSGWLKGQGHSEKMIARLLHELEKAAAIGGGKERLLLVCFAERSDAIRLFSARKATKQERGDHEKGKHRAHTRGRG